MLVRSTLRLKLGAQLRALDSSAECPLALRPISVAFFLGALEAFGSAFGVRGNHVQLANNFLSRKVALNQRADLGVEIDHLFTWAPADPVQVPDHRRLACRDRECQRLALSRSELDDIGSIALRAEDHDPVVASHYRRLVLCYFSSASRFTAGASEFFFSRNIRHDQPVRHARLAMLEDMGLSSGHADRRVVVGRMAHRGRRRTPAGRVLLGSASRRRAHSSWYSFQ